MLEFLYIKKGRCTVTQNVNFAFSSQESSIFTLYTKSLRRVVAIASVAPRISLCVMYQKGGRDMAEGDGSPHKNIWLLCYLKRGLHLECAGNKQDYFFLRYFLNFGSIC